MYEIYITGYTPVNLSVFIQLNIVDHIMVCA